MTRLRISIISLIVTTMILALKFLAYNLTGSAALKSDALESVVNLVSAAFTLGAVIFAERPADKTHPYGHGKIEYFSAAFEGGLISLAAILILYEAAKGWIVGAPLRELDHGLLLNMGAGALNGLLGWGLVKAGRSTQSTALTADGHHVLSDFYTTIALTTGLFIVKLTGLEWLDPILAGLMGLILAVTGFKLVRDSSKALLDQEDPQLVERLIKGMEANRTEDIINVHGIRTLRSGRYTHIDIHVTAPEFYSLEKSHDLVDAFGKKTLQDLNIEGEFHTHIDPCRKKNCTHCSVNPCPIRQDIFQNQISLVSK
ncbi:MAG: cation transporter [Deltaproteobacteria bacterium]|nr:MAG: cation transporter [Deltaproteobacteria bacterium]